MKSGMEQRSSEYEKEMRGFLVKFHLLSRKFPIYRFETCSANVTRDTRVGRRRFV